MGLRIFLTGLLAIVSVLTMVAQDVVSVSTQAVSDSVSPQEENIIQRLTDVSAGVSIEGPAALFQRAVAVAVPDAETELPDEELTEEMSGEHQDADKQRVRGKQVGYRVQVYADNNVRSAKTEARQRERSIGNAFPQYGTYVSYASPFWRLRVGDFRSQYEAEKAASEIKRQFPSYAREVRVVRDRVNVK